MYSSFSVIVILCSYFVFLISIFNFQFYLFVMSVGFFGLRWESVWVPVQFNKTKFGQVETIINTFIVVNMCHYYLKMSLTNW